MAYRAPLPGNGVSKKVGESSQGGGAKDFPRYGWSISEEELNMFMDLKFVCFLETFENMRIMSQYVNQALGLNNYEERELTNIVNFRTLKVIKAGPVLCVGYGLASPPLTIILEEFRKILNYSKEEEDPIFLLLGTSDGLGIQPGTVVVSTHTIDCYRQTIEGSDDFEAMLRNFCPLNRYIYDQLLMLGADYIDDYAVTQGKTMCSDDGFEGLITGVFQGYLRHNRSIVLRNLRNHGVKNIDSTSLIFGSVCHALQFKAGIITVTTWDCIEESRIQATIDVLREWQNRVLHLAALYIKKKIEKEI